MKTDSPHILCVNPWIHDFAAFDFWAKPLGLLSIAAILRENGANVSFIDCLDRFHPRQKEAAKVGWDGRGPYRKTSIEFPPGLESSGKKFSRYGIDPDWFREDLTNLKQPDLILVTSMMTYWASGVKETIDVIKQIYPGVPVVLGGIYASLCHGHAKAYAGADQVIKGPGEHQLNDLTMAHTGVDLHIPRVWENLDDLPYPAFDLSRKQTYIPILTSRGCPFSCEYCASSYLEPLHRRRSPENVFGEIEYWHKKYQVQNFAFYDDALLVNAEKYAYVLFEKIIASGMALFFHTPNALHIKAITKKAARLMFEAGFKTIRLGLETTKFGERRDHDIKVEKQEFFKAVEHLKSAGFEKNQIGAYLLCGLPGQNLDDVEYSMRLVIRSGILPVLAYYTPIPHTPMWEEAVANSKFEILQHPVFTNNTLFPCVDSNTDLHRISQLKNL